VKFILTVVSYIFQCLIQKSSDLLCKILQEIFEDTKGVVRIHESNNRQYNEQKKKEQKQSMVHKKLLRRPKVRQHEPK